MIAWFAVLASIAGVALANYNQIPTQYQRYNLPAYSGYPEKSFQRFRSYHSRSESNSLEDEGCRSCRKLKIFRNETLFARMEDLKLTYTLPMTRYFNDENGCKRAVLSCPTDGGKYTLLVPYQHFAAALSSGFFAERVVKCHKNGSYQATAVHQDEEEILVKKTVYFSKATCVNWALE